MESGIRSPPAALHVGSAAASAATPPPGEGPGIAWSRAQRAGKKQLRAQSKCRPKLQGLAQNAGANKRIAGGVVFGACPARAAHLCRGIKSTDIYGRAAWGLGEAPSCGARARAGALPSQSPA